MTMKNIIARITFVFIVIFLLFPSYVSFASNIEGTKTYEDYLVILVHGINGGSHHFNGQDGRDSRLRLKQHLENDLGLKGYVYAYSFKDKNGSSLVSVRELADRSYNNMASYIDESGRTVSMNGKCWFEKAKEDFKKNNPGKPVPSKYIILTHSMGNMPVRLYIYSRKLLGEDIYQDDVAKVVFIAPPFTGSDLAYLGMIPAGLAWDYLIYSKANYYKTLFLALMDNPKRFLTDPYRTYEIVKEYSFWAINAPAMTDNVLAQFGLREVKLEAKSQGNNQYEIIGSSRKREEGGDLVRGSGYCYLDAGLYELMPERMMSVFPGLLEAKLKDDTKEPAYSVVYGSGSPIPNLKDAAMAHVITKGFKYIASDEHRKRLKSSWDEFKKSSSGISIKDFTVKIPTKDIEAMTNAGKKIFGEIFDDAGGFYNNLNNEAMTLVGSSAFAKLPTTQAKFLSLTMSNPMFVFSDDGDCAVPVESARGIYYGQRTRALRNAKFYKKVFKSGFNDFLEKDFPIWLTSAYSTYAFLVMWGMPPDNAAMICQWGLVAAFISNLNAYSSELQATSWIHTNTMLKQYDLIEKAVLDTPAIFTVQDIQTTIASTKSATSEVTAMKITSPRAPPNGYESLKIKSLKEDRVYKGNQNMAIPITVDGKRKYVNEMVFTKPPLRIEGKLNYLIPAKMKQFQYSFNFAAWKDIKNVDPKTGEFVLDKLPFAEGQNVLAIRSTNAVDVKAHQVCKFIINTIPMLVSKMTPAPNSYTNNNKPTISGEFNKSVYTTGKDIGGAVPDITSAELHKDGKLYKNLIKDSNFKEENLKVNDYKTVGKFSYKPNQALPDGEYKIIVKAKSEIGASQGVWSFWVDTEPPELEISF